MSNSYEKRVIESINWKIKHYGSNSKKYKRYGYFKGLLSVSPAYPFKYTVSNELDNSVLITIKTNKKTNNLQGIIILQKFLLKKLGHTPTIDELSEYISLFTLDNIRQNPVDNNKYKKPPKTLKEFSNNRKPEVEVFVEKKITIENKTIINTETIIG